MKKTAIKKATRELWPFLAQLWERSVNATHDFLAQSDFEILKKEMVTLYLPGVKEIWIAEFSETICGFLGCTGHFVEMLFIDPDFFGHGVGSALLAHASQLHGPLEVDVNEQNRAALAFYLRRNFSITGRSPLDGQGRKYPILHLKQQNSL